MLTLVTAPTTEPISLAELKLHLRLSSETLAGDLTTYQQILPGSHAVANNYTTHVGTGIDVLGHRAIVNLDAGAVGAGGTVDVKIQESDDNATYTDVTSGAFTQIAAANDNALYEKAYSGSKQYIRTVAKVLVAACEFGTHIIVEEATHAEDDDLTMIIEASRQHFEDYTRRAILTQVWDYSLNDWPAGDSIKLPLGNLQNGVGTAPVVTWKDDDGTSTTLTVTTDYLVETNGEQCGRIILPYGESWPSGTLYPSNPVNVRYYCGWTSAANVPDKLRKAMLLYAEALYEHGDRFDVLVKAAESLAFGLKLWEEI